MLTPVAPPTLFTIAVAQEAIEWVRAQVFPANDPREFDFHKRLVALEEIRKTTDLLG